jgi:hypothetical protein
MNRLVLIAISILLLTPSVRAENSALAPPMTADEAANLSPHDAAQIAFGQLTDTIAESEKSEYSVLDPLRRLKWMRFWARPHPASTSGLCEVMTYFVHFKPAGNVDEDESGVADFGAADHGASRPMLADYTVGERRYFVAAPEYLSLGGWSQTYQKHMDVVCSSLKSAKGFFPVGGPIETTDKLAHAAVLAMQMAQAAISAGKAPFALTCHPFGNQNLCADPAKVLSSLAFNRVSQVADCSEGGAPCYQLEFGPIDGHVWGTWILKITGGKTIAQVELSQSNVMDD